MSLPEVNIDGKTGVYAVLGSPVSHSLSPLLHNTALHNLGLNCCYVAFQVDTAGIEKALQAVKSLGVKGVNLTHPLKEAALPFLDRVGEQARRAGAVNTVVNRKGMLEGYNTDIEGFRWSLVEDGSWNNPGCPAIILGAGGAARAVAIALAELGVSRLIILNRTRERARGILATLQQHYGITGEAYPLKQEFLVSALHGAGLLVNSLPLDPVDEAGVPIYSDTGLPSGLTVFDLRYSPPQPDFLRWASEEGANISNGLGMLVGQAAKAFEWFTGKTAPRELMLSVIKEK